MWTGPFRGSVGVRLRRASISVVALVLAWQLVIVLNVPYLKSLPYPRDVVIAAGGAVMLAGYWNDWALSLIRIFTGFILAQLVGIPLGLAMGNSKRVRDFTFPVFEILRPIPPIAWIPLAIIFWPTRELSIYFLVFIGAFFVIVINVIRGVSGIQVSLKWAATSFGARPSDVFWKIMVPGSLPSIVTGMTVGMGVSWNVLIAAEMIAGHGGLGRATWEAYTNGSLPLIMVGMISIGCGGYLCSALIRWLGEKAMPWKKNF